MTNEFRVQFTLGSVISPKELAAITKEATEQIAKGKNKGVVKTTKGVKVGYWTWTPKGSKNAQREAV